MPVVRTVVEMHDASLGGVGTNTWFFRTAPLEGVDETGVSGARDALQVFYDTLESLYSSSTSIEFPDLWTEVAEEPAQYQGAGAWTVPGIGSSGILPPSQCIVAGWSTSVANRRGRGRTFLGPINAALLDADGTPLASALTAVRDAQDALIAEFDGGLSGAFGVYSRLDEELRDFTGRTVHNQFGVLTSRRD